MHRGRLARAKLVVSSRNLSQQIDEIKQYERKRFGNEIARAYCKKARAAREGDTVSMRCTAWSKVNGGKSTDTDGVFDTGCRKKKPE